MRYMLLWGTNDLLSLTTPFINVGKLPPLKKKKKKIMSKVNTVSFFVIFLMLLAPPRHFGMCSCIKCSYCACRVSGSCRVVIGWQVHFWFTMVIRSNTRWSLEQQTNKTKQRFGKRIKLWVGEKDHGFPYCCSRSYMTSRKTVLI